MESAQNIVEHYHQWLKSDSSKKAEFNPNLLMRALLFAMIERIGSPKDDPLTTNDLSKAITAANTAETLTLENESRLYLFYQNISSDNHWINLGGTAEAGVAGNFLVKPGETSTFTVTFENLTTEVSVLSEGANSAFTAFELIGSGETNLSFNLGLDLSILQFLL